MMHVRRAISDLNYYEAVQRHCLQEHGARGHESLG